MVKVLNSWLHLDPNCIENLESLVVRYHSNENFVAHISQWPRTIKQLVFNSEELRKRFKIPSIAAEGVRDINQRLYFEYHCLESHESSDAQLWYRSHQSVVVVGFAPNDGWDVNSLCERYEIGTPIVYKIKFGDRQVFDAVEDELLDSKAEYSRPNPPPSLIPNIGAEK